MFRIIVAFFTFLIGAGLTLNCFFYPQIPDISLPETNIGCNSIDSSECQIKEEDRKFWEDKILARFKEKSLVNYQYEEAYRLILLPSFHKPLFIQVSKIGNQKELKIKKLNGISHFGLSELGKLSFEKTRTLSEAEWNSALNLIDEMSFFNTSSLAGEPPIPDGSEWVLEGQKGNLIHTVERITPDEKFGKVCSYFLRLAEVEKEYEGYF